MSDPLSRHKDAIQKIFDVFAQKGIAAYIVGGAVRNPYLGARVEDVDFAVDCLPEKTEELLEAAGIRAIPTGKEHGTITARIGGENYEITSFRKDVSTDGRRAVTEFCGSLAEDALRRDFTINAIYQDQYGNIHDPLGGFRDLEARQLRFVGDARMRIREDYLRILRYFRFRAQYPLSLEADELAVIAEEVSGLEKISPERIGSEMRKLLIGTFAFAALSAARKTGALGFALPEFDPLRYGKWQHYSESENLNRNWKVELVAASQIVPREAWRLSNKEDNEITLLHRASQSTACAAHIGQEYGEQIGWWGLHLRAALYLRSAGEDALFELRRGARAEFPLDGEDLLPLFGEGKALGDAKNALYQDWLQSDFQLSKSDLLARAALMQGKTQ